MLATTPNLKALLSLQTVTNVLPVSTVQRALQFLILTLLDLVHALQVIIVAQDPQHRLKHYVAEDTTVLLEPQLKFGVRKVHTRIQLGKQVASNVLPDITATVLTQQHTHHVLRATTVRQALIMLISIPVQLAHMDLHPSSHHLLNAHSAPMATTANSRDNRLCPPKHWLGSITTMKTARPYLTLTSVLTLCTAQLAHNSLSLVQTATGLTGTARLHKMTVSHVREVNGATFTV